jgi:hypothetical protein
MRRPAERPRLRKREIALAVAIGALAAGAAAGILSDGGGGPAAFVFDDGARDNRTYDVAEFQRVSTVGPQDIVITYGETPSVRAEGSAQALNMLEVAVVDGALTIRPRSEGWQWAWPRLARTTYFVTVPRLDAVALDGSGDVRVDKVEAESFRASVSGPGGDLSIDSLTAGEADFTINGTGSIAAKGTARATRVEISGPGNLRGNGLRSQTADVSVSGPGDAELTVDDIARIFASGPAEVDIAGTARCSVSESGPADVDCEGATD